MDINSLPANSRCLVDANILLYHIAGASADCKRFLERVANEEIQACVTTIIIAEVLHRQMLIEAVVKGLVTPGKALSKLKANPSPIGNLSDYITEVEKLLRLPFTVVEVTPPDIASSHKLRRSHGLFVNDSINLAFAKRLDISDIVTHDTDFNRVPKLKVWEPTDV